MQTSPVLNMIAPVQTQAPKVNDASSTSDSTNSFNQVLSREMADRNSVSEAPKAKEPEAKKDAQPAASGKAQDAKAVDDADKSADDTDTDVAKDDVQGDAATAANDMLALVTSLNPANAAAQTARHATAIDTKDSGKNAGTAVDAATTAKSAIDTAGSRTATGRLTAAATETKTQATATPLTASEAARTAQPDNKADASSEFSRTLGKANVAADSTEAADAANAKPIDATASQTKPVLEAAAKAKEAIAVTASKPETVEVKDIPATPTALQVQQQPAVNNLTHLAAAQASETLAPRVGTPAWDQALGQKVTWMIAGEHQSASLTLNPPDLGPLQVVLNVTNSQANATFVAAQPEVRQALEAAMPRLRDMLSDAGIQLGQATVNSGSQNQQGTFGQQQQSGSNARRIDTSNVRFDTPVQTSRVLPSSSGQGLVDTFV